MIKYRLLCIVLAVEIATFCVFYIMGAQGIMYMQSMQRDNMQLKKEIDDLLQHIDYLEQEIVLWKTNVFYKERVAREQLQMARKDEQIFYVGK